MTTLVEAQIAINRSSSSDSAPAVAAGDTARSPNPFRRLSGKETIRPITESRFGIGNIHPNGRLHASCPKAILLT